MSKATVLVVDDEALIRWSLAERLKSEGYDVLEADTGQAALDQLPEGVDLVLLDFRLPDTDGVSVLRKIKEFDQDILVILLTAYASVRAAVEAMRQGAIDYVAKPFDNDELRAAVARALELGRLERENRWLRQEVASRYAPDAIVAESPRSAEMLAMRPPPFGGPPFGDDPAMMLPALLQGVGLSDDQQKQVRDILKANHQALFANFEQLRAANHALADKLVSTDPVTEQDLQPLVDQVMHARQDIVNQGLKVVLQVRALLSPEQLAHAAEVKAKMNDLRKQMHDLLGEPERIPLGDAD